MTGPNIATASTRERMIEEARSLFADRGFYGVSIAQIAAELDMTKQALLHHFGTKERLYGEVLEQIADELALFVPQTASDTDPIDALKASLVAMVPVDAHGVERSRLLMRELLDNRSRAETASAWYLKSFLEELVSAVRAVPAFSSVSDAEALAITYQLLGAINYYGISEPTLRGIFGDRHFADLEAIFVAHLERLIDAALDGDRALPGKG